MHYVLCWSREEIWLVGPFVSNDAAACWGQGHSNRHARVCSVMRMEDPERPLRIIAPDHPDAEEIPPFVIGSKQQ